MNAITANPANALLPVPDLGCWSLVWYYLQLVQGLAKPEDEEEDGPKLDFSPIAHRTRGKAAAKRVLELRELYAQSPCPSSRVPLPPPPDLDVDMQDI